MHIITFSTFSITSVCVTQYMNYVSVGWLKVNGSALVVPLSALTISHSHSKVLLNYCQNIYCPVVQITKCPSLLNPCLCHNDPVRGFLSYIYALAIFGCRLNAFYGGYRKLPMFNCVVDNLPILAFF